MKFFLILTSFLLLSLESNAKIDNSKKVNEYLNNLTNITKSRLKEYANLKILDKTTAKFIDIKLSLKESFSYGMIQIIAHKCWQAPLSQKPDSKILVEINEVNPKDPTDINNIFLGWLIASSPSISGLEHPIYDVTAISCQD